MPMNSGKDYVAREVEVAQPLMAAGPVGGNQGGDFVVQSIAPRAAAGGGSDPYVLQAIPINPNALREGEALTPSADAEGRVRLRNPLLGVGQPGDPADTLQAAGPGVVAYHLEPSEPLPFDTTQITSAANRNSPKHGDPCHPLAAAAHPPAVCIPILEAGARTGASTTDIRAGMGVGQDGDPMFTLQSSKQHAIAFAQNTRDEVRLQNGDGSISGALGANEGMKQRTYVAIPMPLKPIRYGGRNQDTLHNDAALLNTLPSGSNGNAGHYTKGVYGQAMAVRRLMPVECERLQGFPDNYTLVPVGKKLAADGPRYKQLGNSWAVPHARWVGSRVAAELDRLDRALTDAQSLI